MLTFALAMASANIFWFIPHRFGTTDLHFLWQFMLHARNEKLKLGKSLNNLLLNTPYQNDKENFMVCDTK